jgi:hypothetical protein
MEQSTANAKPYLIENLDAEGKRLERIPAKKGLFKEDWLQQLLHKHPDILPIDCVGENFTPAVSIGREIACIDNLFISPSGCITIVETKLWQNPEAHRTVVAQILDYAKTISRWSFSELNESVKAFTQKHGESKSIYQLVKAQHSHIELDEIEFEQRVQDCLASGRFALLIVGDRIYPDATQLADIIQSAPNMQFTLGFVELKCYQLDPKKEWPLVVVPHFIAKTKEVTRAVVKVVYEQAKPEVQITAEEDTQESGGLTNEKEFLASLPSNVVDLFKLFFARCRDNRRIIKWGTVGFSLRAKWCGKTTTIFEAYPKYLSIFQEKNLSKEHLPPVLHQDYKKGLLSSPTIGNLYLNDRKYINYAELTDNDIRLILELTDKFAGTIHHSQRFVSQGEEFVFGEDAKKVEERLRSLLENKNRE